MKPEGVANGFVMVMTSEDKRSQLSVTVFLNMSFFYLWILETYVPIRMVSKYAIPRQKRSSTLGLRKAGLTI